MIEKENYDGDNQIINNENNENFLNLDNKSLINTILNYKNEDANKIHENQGENDYLKLLTKELKSKQLIIFQIQLKKWRKNMMYI